MNCQNILHCQFLYSSINPSIFYQKLATMGLGVLDDHKLERVPGTVLLNELGQEAYNSSGVDSANLKQDPTGRIVLVPQPSDSPLDPYNWSRWKKERFTIAYAFACGAVGGKFRPKRG
jgi:hypothetical protein